MPRIGSGSSVGARDRDHHVSEVDAVRAGSAGSRAKDAACIAVLVLLAGLITVLGVVRAPSLSAYDEATHIDYVWNVAHGEFPAAGSELAQEVRDEWSCRSQDNARNLLPPCGQSEPADQYPNRGENYNYKHPPLYYGVTAAVVRVVEATPLDLSFITVARLTGAAWLAAALVVLYLVLRVWSVPRMLALSAGLLLASVPSVAHSSSIVTNDAPAALSGVLALWVLTRVVVSKRLGWLAPSIAAFGVAATKIMTSIAMLSVAAVLASLAIVAIRRGRRSHALRLGGIVDGIVGATAAVYVGWKLFQSGRGLEGWRSPVLGINTSPVNGMPWDEWFPTLASGFGIAGDYWLQDALRSVAIVGAVKALTVAFTAAPFMAISAFEPDDPPRLLGWASLIGAASMPLIVQVHNYICTDYYFRHVTGRYGLSLLPLIIAALAMVVNAKRWRWAYYLLALGATAILLLSFSGVF